MKYRVFARSVLPWLIFTVSLSAQALDELPEHVYFKDHEQSFSTEYYYALKDGKLWIKPNEELSGVKGEWTLFEGTGVPFGEEAKSFGAGGPDEKIVQFSTEGLMVVAASSRGRLYFWQPTFFEPTVWKEENGAPFEDPLLLPANRDWDFSMSVTKADYKRRTPMKDINSYYEDTAGNRVEYGLTATIYTLDPDGQVMRYWDTGLPVSWQRAFASPERGRFIVERMSTAGSTIFVVDKSGKSYTRMYDYEMNGACPGLRFNWKKERQSKNPNEVIPIFKAERVMPLEDWREQPPVPLVDQALITTRTAVRITGQGNAARELRIQGRDASGNYGYWHKAIFAPSWDFKVTNEPFADEKAIKTPYENRLLGRPLDRTYYGTLEQSGEPKLTVELANFYYFNTPSTLRVKSETKTLDLTLHIYDGWGASTQSKLHPELVGNINGEPKMLVGTLEIPDELLYSTDPETKSILDVYFRRFHHKHHAFLLKADDGKVEVKTQRIQRETTAWFDYAWRTPIFMTVARGLSPEEQKLNLHNGFSYLADAPALKEMTSEGLERNRALLREFKKMNSQRRWEQFTGGLTSLGGTIVWYPVMGFLNLIGHPGRNDLWGGLSRTGGSTFSRHTALNLGLAFQNPADYERAVETLKRRISTCEKLLGGRTAD